MDTMNISYSKLGLAVMVASAVGLALTTFASQSHSAETARVTAAPLKLSIDTRCDSGNATFQIQNTGHAWPKASTFAVYRLAKGKAHLIAKRRMRLKAGQKASFRVKASRNTTGNLGLNVDPSWYKRKKVLDARLTCR